MRFIRSIGMLFIILMFWVPPVLAFELCFVTDLGCIAPLILPEYDSKKGSEKEWSSSRGEFVARDNYILVKLRFDEESLSVLRNGKPYGIEVEAVIEGQNASLVSLDYIRDNFPESAHVGKDTEVCDFATNENGSKTFALHILNASAIEKDTDYFVIFFLNDQLPANGVTVQPNLQITIDVDYGPFLVNMFVDAYDVLNQYQHYVLETDSYYPFKAFPDKYQGTCWSGKGDSYNCPGSDEPFSGGTIAPSASGSDAPLVSNASSVKSNYGAYTAPAGTVKPPIVGPRTDFRPDFDVYDTSGHEISANCDDCSGKSVLPGQTIRAKLWTEVSNKDAASFKRSSKSDSIEGPVWWKIEGKTGWNLLASGEYTISKLNKGKKISETHTWLVPNYPGDILAMKACVDGDDEIWEEGESSSSHDIDNPDQSGTTNNCSRTERFYIQYPNYMPAGAIESADCSKIIGWAKDQNTPSSLNVHIYTSNQDGSDMQFLTSEAASFNRSDIGGRYGLEWNFPDSFKDGIARIFYFYAINIPEGSNPLIASVPLTCAPKTLSSSEKAAIQLLLQQ